MYTQCPQCLTYFQVTPEHLRIAQGNVRCGQCRNVFSALGNLTEEPPQVRNEDNDDELEEEIFIDEGELEDYAEEYSEEFYVLEEEIEEESIDDDLFEDEFNEELSEEGYEEEYEETREELDQPSEATPVDVEKTNILPTPAQTPSPAPSRITPPQNRAINNSSKLSEAIATIEKLKQSYTNLSFRQLENRDAFSGNSLPHSNHSAPYIAPPDQSPAAQSPKPAAVEVKPSPGQNAVTPPAGDSGPKPKPSDIAIEPFPEDDGVDYEEALNALNDLKILDEESESEHSPHDNTESEAISDLSEETGIQEEMPEAAAQSMEFHTDLSIDENELVGEPDGLFVDQEIRAATLAGDLEENLPVDAADSSDAANRDIKVKSLDRKAERKPATIIRSPARARPKAVQKPTVTQEATQEAPKFLPAIPKQLLEDFHPGHDQSSSHHTVATIWALGSIMLMVVFLMQTVYFKHNDLAQLPQLRPWVETFCGYMSCKLGLPSDVSQLELVSQDIRTHPKVKSALLVTTTIINNARYAQSFPGLQITFSDLNGQRVAMRRFAPHEYLSYRVDKAAGMPPNTPIQIELELMDPGSNAVNFEFDFIPLT